MKNYRLLLSLLVLFTLFYTSKSVCATNQFTANGVCISCSITCATCSSSLTTSCLTCPSTRFLNAFNACQCNNSYVEQNPVGAACVALNCNYTCATCNNTETTCTSCSAANNRVYVSGNNTCPCAAKYFDNGTGLCASCHFSCTTCSASTVSSCLTCDSANAYRSISGTSCLCIAGYFNNGTYICAACSYKCLTCSSSATTCLTCGGNRGATPTCLANQGYYDDGISSTCPLCHYSCQNCSDGVSCNVCNASNFRFLSNLTTLCACMPRFFQSGVTLCSACDNRCYTCVNSTVCLTCNSTAYRTYDSASKFCVCMVGYYQTSTTLQQCSPCNSRCLTCYGTSTNCTSCDASMNRAFTSNTCPCKTGFYQNAFVQCYACHSSCYSCTNVTACTACVASTLMTINSSNLCSCITTMFYNTTVNICQTCNYQCATCDPSSPTICTTCPANSFRTLSSSACPCNTYYYDSGLATCTKCHYSCRTCTGTTSTTCTNCTTAAFRYSSGSSCLCQVLYYDSTGLEICQPCSYMCLTCLDANTCTSCNTTLYRTLVSTAPAACGCITYYFQNNRVCVPCNYSCYSCNTFTTCLTCNSTSDFRVFNATTQMCDCMPGYYDNFVNRTCLPCLPECYTCTNATTCTSCSAARYRTLTATNLCPCINLYFDVAGTCTGCLYFCATCTSPTTCSTCNSTAMRLLNSSSVCICANNYYDDGSNQLCQPCSYACLTCVGTSKQCTTCDMTLRLMVSSWCTCPQHYYDNNVTVACVKCHYTCSTCLRESNCSTCNSAIKREFDAINQYCVCGIGYFDDGMNEQCQACNYRCLICTNSSKCLTCSAAWFRATPASMCPCLDGYYDDGSNATCKKCHYTCKTCTDGTQCMNCDLTTNHRVFDSTYLCACIDRFFDDTFNNQLCQPCVYTCLTCLKITSNCTTCNSTAYRVLQSNNCNCRQHFYDNLAQQCLTCDYTCSTCVTANKCSTCNSTIQRIADAATGKCKCNDMFWDDGSNQACKACQPTCLTCLNLTNCISCNSTRNRLLNSTIDFFNLSSPFCVCLYRYYSPALNNDCLPCHYSCQVCTAGTRNDCVLCTTEAKRFLNTSVKACQCLNGYYDNNSTQICQLCHIACTTCTTGLPNSCTACSSLYYHLVETTSCFSSCPFFYFNQQANWTCQSCSSNCKSCINGTYCSVCANGYLLYQQKCISICPGGTYANNVLGVCLDCPKGCFNCTGNSLCTSCFSGFYFNSSLGFCFSCNSVCLNCTGPGQKDCTACASPLVLQKSTCSVLSCEMGTYIDPVKGCQPCSNLFRGSLLCNISQPFSCTSNYLFLSNTCQYCDNVTGYKLVGGKCRQICGDGILIYLQCDDGNLIDGDGCSSKCTIESGWNCSVTNSTSACQLINPLKIAMESVSKVSGVNKITIKLSLSLPMIISSTDVQIIIAGFSSNQFSYNISQSKTNLSAVKIQMTYYSQIQGKSLQLIYGNSSRRLSSIQLSSIKNEARQLAAISFQSTFSIDTYPPANYYPDSTIQLFQKLQSYITALSIALLVLSLIIVPKRMHLHSISFVYIPAQIFIVYCLVASRYTDWIQYSLQFMNRAAMLGGFSMGQCCQSTYSTYSLTSQITLVCGIALFVLIGSWILLALIQLFSSYCLNIGETLKNFRYFIFTVNLCICFIVIYASFNTLYNYTLKTKTDVFNTVLAIFLNIFFFVGLLAIWVKTYELRPIIKARDGKIFSVDKSNDIIVNLPPISQVHNEKETEKQGGNIYIQNSDEATNEYRNTRTSKFTQKINIVNGDQEPLVYDYLSLYVMSVTKEQGQVVPTKSKYYLPMLITKIYLTAILSSLMQTVPFHYMIVLAALQVIFLCFLLVVSPFQSSFTNFRLILMSLTATASHVIMCIYLFQSIAGNYSLFFQKLVVYMLLGTLASAVLFVCLEHFMAWRRQIWRKVFEPCLKGSRFMGTRRVPVFQMEASQRNDKTSMKMSKTNFSGYNKKEQQGEQMDAFYARMLKKQQLNKKYKRERMMR